MPTVNSDGVAIDYEVINPEHTDTPVFLITGLGGIRGIWMNQIDAFSATRPLILHDHRGTGKSAKPSGVYSVPNMAKDIIAIMNDLEIEQAHLVGSSTGGAIIQVMCIDYPERVKSGSIVSSWPKSDAYFTRQFSVRKEVLLEMGWEPYTRFSTFTLHSPKFFTDNFQEIQLQENQSIANAPPAEIMAERIDCIIAHDQLDRLGQITCPVLVAVARDDVVTPLYYSHQLSDAIPGAELKIFDEGGHFVYIEKPVEFNESILEFIHRHD
ncbi:MAG: alpha/beta hydrolase [Nitrospinae bacterium]|nr:alpha/beta hydrolase [Nitrospinota bacterium]